MMTFEDLAIAWVLGVALVGMLGYWAWTGWIIWSVAKGMPVVAPEKASADSVPWAIEKQRYRLKSVSSIGNFAYVLKPELAGTEAPRLLCTCCFDRGTKSTMQAPPRLTVLGSRFYACPTCELEITVDG
jgi:hypothetical protein